MTIGNQHGPIRWLILDGDKKTFRSKKDLDRFCDKNGLTAKPDPDDDTNRTFIAQGSTVPIRNLGNMASMNDRVIQKFKTTEQEFEEWFAEFCVSVKEEGCWEEPENLHDVMYRAYLAGVSSIKGV